MTARKYGSRGMVPEFDYDVDASADTWRLFAVDVAEPCCINDCPSQIVAWQFGRRMYCNACAQQLRDVIDRLVDVSAF